jgi:hypothetical protein
MNKRGISIGIRPDLEVAEKKLKEIKEDLEKQNQKKLNSLNGVKTKRDR